MSDIHALSGAYAVDALDDIERAEFERHLADCESCQAEVASLREATAAMSDDVALAPPPELRAAVLDGIARVRPLPPVTPTSHRGEGGTTVRRRWLPALVAAAVLAVVGVGAAVWQPWQDDETGLTATERVLADPDAQRVSADLAGGGTATIVRSAKERRSVIVTEDLPPAPDGKVYQLWLQTPTEEMVSAGLMATGSDTALLEGASDEALAAGLSLEPEGGSDQPTDVLALFPFEEA